MKYVVVAAAVAVSLIMAQAVRAQSVSSTHAMFGGPGGLGGASSAPGGGFGRFYYGGGMPPGACVRLTPWCRRHARIYRARNYRR